MTIAWHAHSAVNKFTIHISFAFFFTRHSLKNVEVVVSPDATASAFSEGWLSMHRTHVNSIRFVLLLDVKMHVPINIEYLYLHRRPLLHPTKTFAYYDLIQEPLSLRRAARVEYLEWHSSSACSISLLPSFQEGLHILNF